MNGYAWPRGTTHRHYIDAVTGCPPSLDPTSAEAQIAAAPRVWAAVANLTVVRTYDRSDATLVSFWDPSVHRDNARYLAETQMPEPGGPIQLLNRIDPNPMGGLTLDELFEEEVHEIGHYFGQVHETEGRPSIMAPELDRSLRGQLTPLDVANIQADYGPAALRLELPDGGTLVYTPPDAPAETSGAYAPTTVELPDGSTLTIQYVPPPNPRGDS